MYILDTDHLSFIQRNNADGQRILDKLAGLAPADVAVTVITYEEQVRGRLKLLTKSKKLEAQVMAYQGLQQLITDYQVINVLPFNHQAGLNYQWLCKRYPRLGKMDLKIAAIAIASDATLLSRNHADFGRIVELRLDDWTTDGRTTSST